MFFRRTIKNPRSRFPAFTETNEIQSFFPYLSTFLLKGQKIVYLDKTWFTINNNSTQLRLFFTNLQTKQKVTNDCTIYVTVLLQRIK